MVTVKGSAIGKDCKIGDKNFALSGGDHFSNVSDATVNKMSRSQWFNECSLHGISIA
jgi:hypothetical protein